MMIEKALRYIARGFAVFPVQGTCKPGSCWREGVLEHGVKDATTDPVEAAEYWGLFPGAGVSAACGTPSGVFVIDCDDKDGFSGSADLALLEKRHGKIPDTWTSSTPSNGRHVYFRQPARTLRNRVHIKIFGEDGVERKSGLDIRATGAAVPLPPTYRTVGTAGPYAWINAPARTELADCPDWLLEILDPPEPPKKDREPLRLTDLERAARYVARAVEDECHALARTKQGGRNQQLYIASARLGELVGAKLLREEAAESALERAAEDCGLHLDDGGMHGVRTTIKNGLTKGISNPREVAL